jgi:hypothetical protein
MDKESLQENEYEFPYHHLVNIRPFSESRHLFWGYRYAAYVEHILQTLAQKQFESLIDFGCGDGKSYGGDESEVSEIAKKDYDRWMRDNPTMRLTKKMMSFSGRQ